MDKKRPPAHDYVRYTSLGIQMVVIVCFFVFIGYKCDHWLNLQLPVCTLVFSLFGIGISIYIAIKDFLSKK
ncbi:MAG: AtpZ/AtpI family protein [Bacteroidales bacterium]|nr:AtpZ/AtpI family protein [Bacteroidales bacterium]MBQ4477322.1 AtpZ/AtpI family protein [Bacteroidales bacterium]MBR4453451.1 AtpZ/AtpI family protein [Bacteroidales bacterium]MCR5555308.1 AtpZ/AtpI family protein [Bacteroidales bacterium]